jgi:O-succinylbenzoate synthase
LNATQLYRYRLPLVAPVRSGDRQLTCREGLLIRQTEGNRESWAEAAPLPGYSVETLSEVIKAARQRQWNAYPSLQFASASLSFGPAHGNLVVNALLMGEMAKLRSELERASQLPHSTVKLKVARGAPLEEEIDIVQTLRRSLRPDQRLRLDANRGWSYDQALEFCRAIGDCDVEYLEEPTQDPSDFERLAQVTSVPYALDETLREPISLGDFPNAAALIIKPTLLGGPEQLETLFTSAIPCVVSAAFESGIGILNIARLASHYPNSLAAGLDTYRWLADDVLHPRLSLERGLFDLTAAWKIDFSRLEELPWR